MCKMLICVLFLISMVTSPAVTRVTEHISSSFKTPTPVPKPGNCILPSYPDHGTYEVSNPPSARPGQSFENFVLTVSCQRGYGLMEPDGGTDGNGTQTVYCLGGVMYQNMPECVLFCRLDPDPSVRFMCQIPGTNGFKTCKHYVAPGTIVNPVCNTPNYDSSEMLRYMKCIGGSWDYIAQCKAGLPKNRTNIIIFKDKVEIDVSGFFNGNNNNNNKVNVNLGSSSASNNNNNVYNLTNNNILNIYINNNRYVNGMPTATVNSIDSFHVNGSNKNNNEISLAVGSSGANNNNNNKYNLTNNNVLNIHINNNRYDNGIEATSTVNPIEFVNENGSNKNNNKVSVNVGSSGVNNNNYKKYNLTHDHFLNIYINNNGYSVKKLSTKTDFQ